MADPPSQAPETGPRLRVAGGVGGSYARYEDVERLARYTEDAGADLAGIAAKCHGVMVDPDVLASAVLDPAGFAHFETALLGALDGRDGLTALALELRSHGALLRTAANSYRALDEGYATLVDSIFWAGGVGAGVAATGLVALAPAGALGLGLGAGVGAAGAYLAGDAAGVNWQRLLTDHLGVVDGVVRTLPGLITGLPLGKVATDVPSGARVVGLLYPDGEARVRDLPPDTSDGRMTKPPAGFADVLAGLDHRNAVAQPPDPDATPPRLEDRQGQIDVRVVTRPDGTRSYIVDIPGTKEGHVTPLQHNERLNDHGTNVHALGGETTAYGKGIVEALRRAGAHPDSPVMLVGHSQGGIVAAQVAVDLARSKEFNVTHVVTAASPVARFDIPESVKVLSLENEHDLVPRLDGAGNPDRPNRVTVSFAQQNGGIVANHSMHDVYLPVAPLVDRSTDPSVAAYRESAAAFFDGTAVESKVYEITRTPAPK
jgi:hypothetical protein